MLLAGVAARAQSPADILPAGPGKEIVATACNQCHGLRMVATVRYGPVGWKEMVDNMVLRGAQVEPGDMQTVVDYLLKSFGPGAHPMQSPAGAVLTLPDGPGKDAVQARCTLCHDVGRITESRRSKEEWEFVVTRMTHWTGLPVSNDDIQTMTTYLTAQFGRSGLRGGN